MTKQIYFVVLLYASLHSGGAFGQSWGPIGGWPIGPNQALGRGLFNLHQKALEQSDWYRYGQDAARSICDNHSNIFDDQDKREQRNQERDQRLDDLLDRIAECNSNYVPTIEGRPYSAEVFMPYTDLATEAAITRATEGQGFDWRRITEGRMHAMSDAYQTLSRRSQVQALVSALPPSFEINTDGSCEELTSEWNRIIDHHAGRIPRFAEYLSQDSPRLMPPQALDAVLRGTNGDVDRALAMLASMTMVDRVLSQNHPNGRPRDENTVLGPVTRPVTPHIHDNPSDMIGTAYHFWGHVFWAYHYGLADVGVARAAGFYWDYLRETEPDYHDLYTDAAGLEFGLGLRHGLIECEEERRQNCRR